MRVLRFVFRAAVTLLAGLGLVVVVLAVVVGLAWERLAELRGVPGELPPQAVITLDLAGGVRETASDLPFGAAAGDGLVLRETVDALHAAAGDPRVEALFARLGRGDVGMAQAQALRDAVAAFRAGGKPAFAFAEDFGEGGLGTRHAYLASAFDRIWLQPSGGWGATGFLLETPFLKEALAKLGVVARLDQRKAYKGIADQFTANHMRAAQRRNLQRLLDSWLAQVTRGIAEGRGLQAAEVRRFIDSAPLSAEQAKAAGLVDEVGYRDEAEAALRQAAGAGEAELVAVADYARRREAEEPSDGPVVAVVHGLGPVVLGESDQAPVLGRATMGSDTVAAAILEAAEDDEVAAIVFRVDSPGGSYIAADAIWRAVKKAGEAGTPVVVSFGDLAASGGYFVAAPAARIVAQPGSITGSIGVASGKFVLSGLWDKLGVAFDGVQAGRRADMPSANSDYSQAEWAEVQAQLDRIYADFTGKVAAGRGLDDQQIAAAAQGRVWSGADAQRLGLVDALGGFRTAVDLAKEAAGVAPETRVRLEPFPAPEGTLDLLLRHLVGGRLAAGLEPAAARELARAAAVLAPLVEALAPLATEPGAQPLRAGAAEAAP